jgi:hypothetical protein
VSPPHSACPSGALLACLPGHSRAWLPWTCWLEHVAAVRRQVLPLVCDNRTRKVGMLQPHASIIGVAIQRGAAAWLGVWPRCMGHSGSPVSQVVVSSLPQVWRHTWPVLLRTRQPHFHACSPRRRARGTMSTGDMSTGSPVTGAYSCGVVTRGPHRCKLAVRLPAGNASVLPLHTSEDGVCEGGAPGGGGRPRPGTLQKPVSTVVRQQLKQQDGSHIPWL